MKFREIVQFELKYQLGRYLTWIFFIVVLAFAALSAWSMWDNVEEGEYYMNSPVVIGIITAVSGMFCLLLTAAVSGNAAVRDIQAGMEPLIYTASMKKITYLGGRFMAAFIIQLLVLAAVMILFLAATFTPGLEEYFMPFRAVSYISSFLLFAVPNALITTAVLFSLAVITRSAMISFFGAGLLFFMGVFSMDIISGELGMWELGKKLDPSGVTVLRELRITQTPMEMPVKLVQLDSSLLVNRLLWLGVGFIFLTLAYVRFDFVHHTSGNKKRLAKKPVNFTENSSKIWSPAVSHPADTRIFDLKNEVRQVIYLSIQTLKGFLKGKVWLIIIAILFIIAVAAEEVMEGQLGVPTLATSWRVLSLMKFLGLNMVFALLIAFYTGEMVWKERDCRLDEMTDAAPISNRAIILSKLTGLFLFLLLMQAIVLVAGILIQVLQDNPEVNLSLYLQVLFGFRFLEFILFAIVALCLHVLVNQKYLGYLVIFMVYYYMSFPETLGLEHNLLVFGSGPGISYSEISGYGSNVIPWLWFRLFWIGWAFLMAIVILLFWNRGKEQHISRRLALAKYQFSGKIARLGVPGGIMIFLVGGYIFYNTNILNNYTTAEERTERRALYEKKYGKYKGVPQPLLTAVKLEVEFYPEERKVEIFSNYKIVNKSGNAIDTIHISTNPEVETGEIKFSRKATGILADDELGHRMYKLEKPLQPGDTLSLEFRVHFRQEGFSDTGFSRGVVENGTYLGYHYMPEIGYEANRELPDEKQREKFNLPPQPAMPSLYDQKARMNLMGEEMLAFEAVLGTVRDQTAVTAGTLDSTWTRNNRRYFRYITDVPIRHNYELFSAVYEVHIAPWEDVEIQIFHHPGHSRNLDRMVHGVRSSLAYFSKNFSPYPHRQIRLVEYPGNGVGLNGNPVTMSYSEGFAFFTPERDYRELDFPFAVIAHEVAHQWWGNELRPAYVEGAPLLTESLAWYSAMAVFEETFGKEKLSFLLQVMRQEYLTPRSVADVPLLKSTDKFNAYRKGPFAMYALKEYVGEQKVNTALQNLLQKFSSGEPPLPVSLDLYAELQSVTPDSLQYLLKDLFERNTFWELKAEKATVERIEGGLWQVNLDIKTGKTAIDDHGLETKLPMNDYVEIGIYANSPKGSIGELLYLEKHRLPEGEQTLIINVSKEPDLAAIDPNRLLIDRQMYDNFIPVIKE